MRWVVTEGEEAEARRNRLEAHGKTPPDDLYPPEVLEEGEDWLHDFWELSTDRQILEYSGSFGPIPSASISRHCEGWDEDETALFRRCIRAMDAEFLRRDEPETERRSGNPARDAFRAAMGG